jgi:hypothetical protein
MSREEELAFFYAEATLAFTKTIRRRADNLFDCSIHSGAFGARLTYDDACGGSWAVAGI